MIRRHGCKHGMAMRSTITMTEDNVRRLAKLAARYDTLKFRDAIGKEKRVLNVEKLRYDVHVAQCEECSR